LVSISGDIFDVKDFHLQILENGAMPLNVLEHVVENWISNVKSTQSAGRKSAACIQMMVMGFLLVLISNYII